MIRTTKTEMSQTHAGLYGRLKQEPGVTMVLVYDFGHVGHWKSIPDWTPIRPHPKEGTMVEILIDGVWYGTFRSELETKTAKQIYGFAADFDVFANVQDKKTLRTHLLHMFNCHFSTDSHRSLRAAAFTFLHSTDVRLVEQKRDNLVQELTEAQFLSAQHCEKGQYDQAAGRSIDGYWIERVLNARRSEQ